MTEQIQTQLLQAPAGIPAAAEVLRAGGLVAFPTETVYGLGADAANPHAVAGIFSAKGRPSFNPLIVHVATLKAARDLVAFNAEAEALAEAFWPGPLTLVLPKRNAGSPPELVTAGLPFVGIRIPAHPTAQALLHAFGGPIAAPSANRSGKVSPTTAAHVAQELSGRIDAILDGGSCEIGLESTIIGFSAAGPTLLRPGGIPVEAIEACLGVGLNLPQAGLVTAPGQLQSHYAPGVALRLDADAPRANEGWLGFGPGAFAVLSRNLSPAQDLREAAANLFAALRDIDAEAARLGIASIAVARIPETGLGRAINDRLRRAAAPRSGPPAFG